MFKYIIQSLFLKDFYQIDLSGVEKEIASESVANKYAPSLKKGLLIGIFVIPAILFLDSGVLTSVLIPITMVTGTAWFAISLASMKKKFESFGLELTTNMFTSFVSSLIILGFLAVFSFFSPFTQEISAWGANEIGLQLISAVLATLAVLYILWSLMAGSLKYDMNDAMLTGQNEAAERFFKKSLSLLHASAENLRGGKGIIVANYYIGISFFEIFSFIKSTGILNGKLTELMGKAMKLKQCPSMKQEEADAISIELIDSFIHYCSNIEGPKSEKSFANIKDELNSIKKNTNEPQEMVDTRLSIIFEEIAELLDLQGEALFKKKA